MSADNCIYVFKGGDRDGPAKFGISMEFLSDDESHWGANPRSIYDSAQEAIMAAHHWEAEEDIVEYGVLLGDGVLESAALEKTQPPEEGR